MDSTSSFAFPNLTTLRSTGMVQATKDGVFGINPTT
jgi:hypothetical protein